MPNLDFLVHMPLLRIEDELLPFGPGQLYRMPFDKYNEISLGAFEDQKRLYEATQPVFLSLSVPVPEEGLERRLDEVEGVVELKAPSTRTEMLTQLGLEPVNWVHREFVTPAWSALLLVAPAAALAPPRWSQTFVAIDGGYTIRVGGKVTVGARVQGQADHEYLFLPDAPSTPLSTADVAQAAGLLAAVKAWEQVPDLHAALATLRATGLPVLSPQDRLTIAVQALESLLLPEVQTTLKKTFARRVSALLATDAAAAERLATLAANLYSLRSESVHGSALPDGSDALEGALAEQLLAGAIRAVGTSVTGGETLAAVRARLDEGFQAARAKPVAFQIQTPPTGRASEHRLARPNPSDVFALMSSMAAPEGAVCGWSPLLGLTTEEQDDATAGIPLGDPPGGVGLMPLTPKELWEIEERDIRRDFLMEFVVSGHPMAVLVTLPEPDPAVDAAGAAPFLQRLRDFGVVTLRIAGYDWFHDPELFGTVVFEGKRRLRWPTAVRQTVAEELRHPATQRVGQADRQRLADIWREVWAYGAGGGSDEIEHILGLFRRSFDRDFLDPEQRAIILVSLLEAMLGRFRPPAEPVQLEDLVETLVGGGDAVAWFRTAGRKFRNQVAHGEFEPAGSTPALEHLTQIGAKVLHELIVTWNSTEGEARPDRPSDRLIRRAEAEVGVEAKRG